MINETTFFQESFMPNSWYDDDDDFADEMAQLDLDDQLEHIMKMEGIYDSDA